MPGLESVTAEDIMITDYPRVAKDETLEYAVKLMNRYGFDRAVALKAKKIAGIVTKKDIMLKLGTLRTRNVVPGRLHVSSFMTPDPITVNRSNTVKEMVRIMVENNIGSLPVVENEEPVGLVTRWEISSLLKDAKDLKAVDVMITIPEALKPTHKLLHARQLLLKYDLIYMPVIDEDNRPIGYITVDVIADAFIAFHDIVPEKHRKERIEHLLVDDVMRLRPLVVDPDEALSDIVEKMVSKKSKGAIVVHGERIVGLITLKELVKTVLVRIAG